MLLTLQAPCDPCILAGFLTGLYDGHTLCFFVGHDVLDDPAPHQQSIHNDLIAVLQIFAQLFQAVSPGN